MRSPLQATYDVMLDFARAVSMEQVYAVLLKNCSNFGVVSVLAGIIPDRIIRPEEQPNYVVLGHWPGDWADRYFRKQYVRRDKTIRHAATESLPLIWSNMTFDEAEGTARRIMDEAREYKLTDGVTIPQMTLDGHRIGVSFSGDRIDKSPRAVADLTVLAGYAVARALEVSAATFASPVHLAPKEREVLLWASEGKTNADTAELMTVSVKAVEKYLADARIRLNALTTPQAVAQALRLGILS